MMSCQEESILIKGASLLLTLGIQDLVSLKASTAIAIHKHMKKKDWLLRMATKSLKYFFQKGKFRLRIWEDQKSSKHAGTFWFFRGVFITIGMLRGKNAR